MKTQLLQVYNSFKDDSELLFLTHTFDQVPELVPTEYAKQLDILNSK